MCQACGEMPKYKCYKEVHALRIAAIETADDSGTSIITPEDDGFAKFTVPKEYVDKHTPQPGGYYVVYADGYKSFSPAEAFESGYTRV